VDNKQARRLTNRETAEQLAGAGAYVFQTSGKTPLTPRFNRAEETLTVAEIAEAIEEHEEKHKYKPVQVGATRNPESIKKMARRNMDAMWSIACGPSKIVVIDADQKDGGPEKIAAHFEKHGLPEGCIVVPTQSGGRHYYFSDPEGKFTNAAGLLKKDYGCDVRGKGGQCVAPSSIREDGKTYGTKKHLMALRDAIRDGTLPELPDHITELIGSAGEAAQIVDNSELGKVIKELEESDWPTFEEVFDPTLGEYDLEALKAANPALAELWDNPSSDCSDNRWKLDQHVLEAFKLSAVHLAVLYEEWEGAGQQTDDGKGSGNYNLRDIAREWIKNKDRFKSTGEALSVALDIFEDAEEEAYDRLIAERRKAERKSSVVEVEDDQPSRSYVRDSYVVANYRPIRWLVKRLIPLNSVGALYGLPNVGKSFVVFDLANHARRERDWFGRKVKGGDVLYLYAEGAEGIAGRAKAWADNNDASGGNVALMNGVPNLFSDKKASDKIVAAARECEAESGQPVRLIIVDTLAAATAGADGSSDRDMGLVCERLRKVANELDCAVLIVHHSGKDVSKGMRGSSAILGAVDYSLLVEETKGASTLSVEKMRDARKGQAIKFKLVEVVIGVDEDGEDVTSCIVRPVQAGGALSAVDEDEEVPLVKVPDRREDRVAMLVEVTREEAGRAAAEDEPLAEIGLSVPALVEAINVRRGRFCGLDGQPLAPLNRKAVWRVVETAVEAGQMETRRSKVFLKA
jgi:hypothetical protein